MKSVFINLALFKASWAAAIATAAASVPLYGAIAIGIAVLVHLARTKDAKAESALLLIVAAIGFVWESLLVATGTLQYGSGTLMQGAAPYWIVAMWVLFATTLNVGMRWLRKSLLVAALAGGIGGPLSFLAGASAGAVVLADPIVSLLVIGAGWAVLLPIVVKFAIRFDGHGAQAT